MPSPIAREYLRVSRDASGVGTSPNQQHHENLGAFIREGFLAHPAPPYKDVDRSASRYATRKRDGFELLISDLISGQFDADILALWESSRGSRKVSEWTQLIELCQEKNVRIWVTTHKRLYDPNNSRDRKALYEDAVDAEYESDKSSERIRRNTMEAAQQGLPHGANLFGYRRIYDPLTRALCRVEIAPKQAAVVRDAARMLLEGMTPYAIAATFNARGTPPRGSTRKLETEPGLWTPAAVREMLTTPAYAGKRQHRGMIVGDAIWPSILEPETWARTQTALQQRKRERPHSWQPTRLMTGIASCGVCGSRLRTSNQRSKDGQRSYATYICRGAPGRTGSHVSIKADDLDDVVVGHLLARLGDPAFLIELASRNDQFAEERQALFEEIARLQQYLEDVRIHAEKAGRLDLSTDQESRIQPRIEKAQTRIDVISSANPLLLQFIRSGASRIVWEQLDFVSRRIIIRSAMSPTVNRIDRSVVGVRARNHQRVTPGWL
ncbi:recombinase family protein [Arthrobacter citreus]|uniref:recombinase family protein n=1 Tax=Arthrobacter citreus TaxID=1670 RepID=UPI0036D8A244